ncbi:hypothetical protein NliqN6_6196 [Naganishia liquefaciens]|uniref:Ribosomal protein/NADH dehydrogenase domain-containing protein n=1 Tax=Naganishia liquefaciens TaxID=104408 RepID=A0A8H3U0Z2_9TREE|nr:hypothetical protein NliqN6_6196 [Naganishia liquefaciens]
MSLRRAPLAQAVQSLQNGTGANTVLPDTVRAISLTYTYRRAGKHVDEFIKKIAPRLAYVNPSVEFTISHRPTPSTKAKDPELQKRAEAAKEEIARQGGVEPTMTVEFHARGLDDAPATSVKVLRGMETSRILGELVAMAEGRSTLAQTEGKA